MLNSQRPTFIAFLFCVAVTGTNAQSAQPLPAVDNKAIEIWWGPMIIGLDASGSIDYAVHDFTRLLHDAALWPQTRAAITTLELPGGIFPGYTQMSEIVHWLSTQPNMKLNMTGEYVATGGTCGSGEGLTADPKYSVEAALSAQGWQQAGGHLDYSVMDAPLLYARVPINRGGCGWAIQHIAENVAQTMKMMLRYFPHIRFIDAEGPAFEATSEWLADMKQFHDALAALGTPVYATEIDESWNGMLNGETYAKVVSQAIPFFHINGEHVGLILNLDGTAANQANSAAYLEQYRLNAKTIASGHFGEDWVAVESWNFNLPTYNLPETESTAFSSVIPFLRKLLDQ